MIMAAIFKMAAILKMEATLDFSKVDLHFDK
jgi:hypothetical protein